MTIKHTILNHTGPLCRLISALSSVYITTDKKFVRTFNVKYYHDCLIEFFLRFTDFLKNRKPEIYVTGIKSYLKTHEKITKNVQQKNTTVYITKDKQQHTVGLI